jgi:hypothetical protein
LSFATISAGVFSRRCPANRLPPSPPRTRRQLKCPATNYQCVAIRGRLYSRLDRKIAVGAQPVLNDELLAESVRKPLGH